MVKSFLSKVLYEDLTGFKHFEKEIGYYWSLQYCCITAHSTSGVLVQTS